jgi:hypothetical protein
MYDKYLRGNTFLTGPTGLPKHKGFLFSHSASAGLSAGFYMINDEGNTFFMGLTFASGINILPVGVHSVVNMATGLTGLRLN